jgi:hypothetical protein
VREVGFDSDRMILKPPPRPTAGGMQHREMLWEKISDL